MIWNLRSWVSLLIYLLLIDQKKKKILIKDRENSTQLANCGTDNFQGGLCYPVYEGKQISILRND